MNFYAYLVVTCTFISQSCFCMDTTSTKIITYDQKEKEYVLPQWHIEASRVLYTKQQWQLFKEKYKGAQPAPLQLKTISSDKLTLFFDALNAKNFADHFKALGWKKQRQLIRVAGEKELDSPALTIKLINCCLAPEWIDRINSYVPIENIINHLQYLIILDNCEQKNFVQKRHNYSGENCLVGMGPGYKYLSEILQNQTNFCGNTLGICCPIDDSKSLWNIYNLMDNAEKVRYILTATELAKNDTPTHEIRLLAYRGEGKTTLQKIIQHTNVIELSSFSKNGKYLATSSQGPHNQLLFTDLTIENDAFAHSDLFLTGFNGAIDWISFNNQSTLLAALSEKKLYFWDVKSHTLLATFSNPLLQNKNGELVFNHDDNRLAISSWNNQRQESLVMLWDVSDILHIKLVRGIFFPHSTVHSIAFNRLENRVIIGTHDRAMLLNAKEGNTIMQTQLLEDRPRTAHTWIRAVLMNHLPILVTTTHNDEKECDVTLWDIISGICIVKLLETERKLTGIGVTANCQSIVSTKLSRDMITTDLYNDTVANSLDWSRHKMDLSQKHLLLRLYRASKIHDSVKLDPDCLESDTLQDLPEDFKTLVEKYFR